MTAYPKNELTSGFYIPRYSSANSSAIGNDTGALFLNPASIARAERINALFVTGTDLQANIAGVSGIIPFAGAFAGGVYNIQTLSGNIKQGMFLGWGIEVLDYLSAGISVKTAGASVFAFDEGLYFDAGALFYPNKHLAPFLDRRFLHNRIFISVAFQNIGVRAADNIDEEMNFRLGLSYDIPEIWTKFYVEKNFIASYEDLSLGVEISPRIKEIFGDGHRSYFTVRAGYIIPDNDVRLGVSLNGRDINLDFSYSINRNEFFIGLNGFFERSKDEISKDLFAQGNELFNTAHSLEQRNEDEAIENYKQALQKLKLSLFYNKYNETAFEKRNQVEVRLGSYYEWFISQAQNNENRNRILSALVYYNKAASVDMRPDTREKIRGLSTNQAVIRHFETKRDEVEKLMRNEKFVDARKELITLNLIFPNDRWVNSSLNNANRRINEQAGKLYADALTHFEENRMQECINTLNSVLSLNPDHRDAQTLLRRANAEQMKTQHFAQARRHYNNEEYIQALAIVDRILAINAQDRDARDLRLQIQRRMRENIDVYLTKGQSLYSAGRYEEAIAEFDNILAVEPRHSVALDYKRRSQSKIEAIKQLRSIGE
jgi:tetratricopeptide (TPR) repeat protein